MYILWNLLFFISLRKNQKLCQLEVHVCGALFPNLAILQKCWIFQIYSSNFPAVLFENQSSFLTIIFFPGVSMILLSVNFSNDNLAYSFIPESAEWQNLMNHQKETIVFRWIFQKILKCQKSFMILCFCHRTSKESANI